MQPLEEVRGSQDTNDLIVFHRSFISVSNGKQLVGVPAIQTIHGTYNAIRWDHYWFNVAFTILIGSKLKIKSSIEM